jgi:hypothetical protein
LPDFSLSDVPPVIATPHHFLISIYRCNIFLVAVITSEGSKGVETRSQSYDRELPPQRCKKFTTPRVVDVIKTGLRSQLHLSYIISAVIY